MAQDGTLEGQIGAVDNLNDTEPIWNRPAAVIAMTVIFSSITSTCVLLRLYARFSILKMPGWDDYCMIPMIMMGGVGTVCMCMLPPLGGLGRHLLELSDGEREMYFKLFYIADGGFVTTVSLIKISILLQYLRLFDTGFQRHLCLAMLVMVSIWTVVTSFMAWVPCFPVRAFWDWSVEGAKCYAYGSKYVSSHYATFLAHSVVNMTMDFIIFAIPLQLFFRLSTHTHHRTRLGLGVLVVIGIITNVFAAMRLSETIKHKAMAYPTFDHPWYAPTLCILGMLEVNFACIGASIPVFWPVFKDKLGAIFVTRDIHVSVADRNSSDLHLQRLHSQEDDSSEGDRRLWREDSGDVGKSDHYQDVYVKQQVDPLRTKTTLAVGTTITTGDIGTRGQGH